MSKPKPDLETMQRELVEFLLSTRRITSKSVAEAFLNVPRHLFVPDADVQTAYSDVVIATKSDEEGYAISSSSQPAIMAMMLEQLQLKPGMRVLEIGAGTGYNAALISHIIGKDGYVVSIDIELDLVVKARQHLKNAGVKNVRIIHADGYPGYDEMAPYDRVILTVSPWDISPAWIEQLKPDGVLVVPLTLTTTQASIAFAKQNRELHSIDAVWCGFMPLRGKYAAPKTVLSHPLFDHVVLQADERFNIPIEDVRLSLQGPSSEYITKLNLPVLSGFDEWLALSEVNVCRLVTHGKQAGKWPFMNGIAGQWTHANGLADHNGVALMCRPMDTVLNDDYDPSAALPLMIRHYGEDENVLRRIQEHLERWHSAGQPNVATMQYRLIPIEEPYSAQPGEIVLQKEWNRLIIRWQN